MKAEKFWFVCFAWPLGNNVIVRVTGSNGEYQQWRWWLAPLLGYQFSRPLDTTYGFKNGESVTACVTDVGNGVPKAHVALSAAVISSTYAQQNQSGSNYSSSSNMSEFPTRTTPGNITNTTAAENITLTPAK